MTTERYEIQRLNHKGDWVPALSKHLSGLPVTLESGTSWIMSRRRLKHPSTYRLVKVVEQFEVVVE